jgi:hypothetical protein
LRFSAVGVKGTPSTIAALDPDQALALEPPDCAAEVSYDFHAERERYRSHPKNRFFGPNTSNVSV